MRLVADAGETGAAAPGDAAAGSLVTVLRWDDRKRDGFCNRFRAGSHPEPDSGRSTQVDRRLRVVCFLRWHKPPVRPGSDGVRDAGKISTLLGQLVFDPDGRVGMDDSGDDAFRLQLLEPLGKQAIAQPGHRVDDVREACRSAEHRTQDGARPTSSDELNSPVEVGADITDGVVTGNHGTLASRFPGANRSEDVPIIGSRRLRRGTDSRRDRIGPERCSGMLGSEEIEMIGCLSLRIPGNRHTDILLASEPGFGVWRIEIGKGS